MSKSLKVQKKIDGLIDKIFLRFIPHNIKPNHVTIVRFILIPIIYWLLSAGYFDWALIVFVVAASTDFIDGAMARTRDQITDLGKVIDPAADKLLIMSVLLCVGFEYLIVKVFVAFIVLELISLSVGAFMSSTVGRPLGANVFGKVKMILQSFSVGLFILGIVVKYPALINLSEYILFVALIFAVASAVEHGRIILSRNR